MNWGTPMRLPALLCLVAAAVAAPSAWPLSSDNDQPMDVTASHQKSMQSRTGAAGDPDITDLDGNVIITRGSIKIHADHARIYQIPAGAKDPHAGKFSHIVLTGKPAHMEQLHDGDCSRMSADANTIDYKPLDNRAELTGNVKVLQGGRGESHSQHMIYNTETGDMEAGDNSADSRVHMVLEAQSAAPAPRSDNCGFAPAKAKKPATGTPAH
jgi:lipopolysaccharide export system protein LptA